jgi:hypothetical protein
MKRIAVTIAPVAAATSVPRRMVSRRLSRSIAGSRSTFVTSSPAMYFCTACACASACSLGIQSLQGDEYKPGCLNKRSLHAGYVRMGGRRADGRIHRRIALSECGVHRPELDVTTSATNASAQGISVLRNKQEGCHQSSAVPAPVRSVCDRHAGVPAADPRHDLHSVASQMTPARSAAFEVSLTVPPGTAGHAPKLALTYSSQGGGGLAAAGLSLNGLSAIARCGRTSAREDVNPVRTTMRTTGIASTVNASSS